MVIHDVMKTEVHAHSLQQVILQSLKKQTAHFNAILWNKFRIFSAYLTSCPAGDVEMSGSVVFISPTNQKFLYLTDTWLFTSVGLGFKQELKQDHYLVLWKESINASLSIFVHLPVGKDKGLQCTRVVMVECTSPSQHTQYNGYTVQYSRAQRTLSIDNQFHSVPTDGSKSF